MAKQLTERCVEETDAVQEARLSGIAGGDPRLAMFSSLSWRSGDAISNGVGSIEFWGV